MHTKVCIKGDNKMVERIQISIPKDIKRELDRQLKELEMNRSKFFIVAAYQYLRELKKKEIRKKLEQGYEQMREESKEIANETFNSQINTIKNL